MVLPKMYKAKLAIKNELLVKKISNTLVYIYPCNDFIKILV